VSVSERSVGALSLEVYEVLRKVYEITDRQRLARSACKSVVTLLRPGGHGEAVRGRQRRDYMSVQLQPCAGGAYGSSPLFTGPHTDGT
jgi:hypothetical protein